MPPKPARRPAHETGARGSVSAGRRTNAHKGSSLSRVSWSVIAVWKICGRDSLSRQRSVEASVPRDRAVRTLADRAHTVTFHRWDPGCDRRVESRRSMVIAN
jgi:hypothetical protein